ncbi:MAG: ABC transporter ATP-binding protein [Calditrichia bacterium]
MTNEVVLQTVGLSKVYHDGPRTVAVLRDINLELKRGEIVAIMGPSGVGKSTLLNLLGTLDRPTSGQILIEGNDILSYSEKELAHFRNEHVGFTFQFHYLLPEFSALENVMMPCIIGGNDWKSYEGKAMELLMEVGLKDRMHHKPNQLSGGEQQRVTIARALMNRPRLILADEPTGDLDRRNSEALFEIIMNLNTKYEQNFVIVTHDERFARRAHRIIHLEDGTIDREELLSPAS